MLATVFSRPGRYRRYAVLLSAWLLVYLAGGFLLVKALAGEPAGLTVGAAIGLLGLAALFALMHIRSMRTLDTARAEANRSSSG